MAPTITVKAALVGSVLVIAAGCAGSADDVCARATQHLESCSITTLPPPDTCDPERARRILSSGCGELAGAGTRSTAGFWQWLTGCMCDAECTKYDDCCAKCPKQKSCFCDLECPKYDDCCASCPDGVKWLDHCCIPLSPIPAHQGDPTGCALSTPKELGVACQCKGPTGTITGKALGVCYPPENELSPVDG
jgi:hypothetical protein